MARGDINLHIGTTYSDEGFRKLNNALKTSGGELKKASSMVNQVVGGLGNMDSKAGKVVGTLGNLLGSFAQMGFAGLVIGGITTAFQLVTNKINEAKKAVREMGEALKNRLLAAMGDAEAKATVMQQRFQKMNEGIKRSYEDRSQGYDREAQDEANQVKSKHIQDRKKMTNEHDITLDKAKEQYEVGAIREERILEKAKEKWKLALQLLEAKKREQEETAKALEKAVADEQTVLEKSEKYLREKKRLEEGGDYMRQKAKENPWQSWKWNKEAGKFDVALEKLNKDQSGDVDRLKRASEMVAKARERNQKAVEDLSRMETELQQASEAQKSAELQYSTNMKSLDETRREQIKTVEKTIAAEKKQAEAERKRAEAEKQRKDEETKRKLEREQELADRRRIHKIETETARKMEELLPAIENMKKAADKWQKDAQEAEGKTFGQWQGDKRRQGNDDRRDVARRMKNIMQAEGKRKNIEERIFDRNGRLRRSANKKDVETWNQLNEFLGLQPKNDPKLMEAARKEQDRIGKRIFDKNGRLKRSANRQDVDRWKQLQKNFVRPKNPVEELKKMEDEKNKFAKQQSEDIKAIKEKLNKLGL